MILVVMRVISNGKKSNNSQPKQISSHILTIMGHL